jgi:hypothetical protein
MIKFVKSLCLAIVFLCLRSDAMDAKLEEDMANLARRIPVVRDYVCGPNTAMMDAIQSTWQNRYAQRVLASMVERLEIAYSNSLFFWDGDPSIFSNATYVEIHDLDIHANYLNKIREFPSLRDVKFVNCRVSDPSVMSEMTKFFTGNGSDINGIWRVK